MVSQTEQGKAAIRAHIDRLIAEHRALSERFQHLEAEVARLPAMLEGSQQSGAGSNPSVTSPLGDDPHQLRERAGRIGDIVSPIDVEWDAEH